jgi:PelA/Pel-15E family pectate lyase
MRIPRLNCAPRGWLLAASVMMVLMPAKAEVIGKMQTPQSLSLTRIEELPRDQRGAWMAYLTSSNQQRIVDKAALAAERLELTEIPKPASDGNGVKTMPLDQDMSYYRSVTAQMIANEIVSFQTPAGGWGKNQPRTGNVRKKGQSFVAHDGRGTHEITDKSVDAGTYVGTIDNGATITELRFLSRVSAAIPESSADIYREAIRKGLAYLLQAQYPNGGWPQVWPLDGGYHDAITINDDALIDTMAVLTEMAGAPQFGFIAEPLRLQAAAAVSKAMALILRTQVKVNGVPTIWGQQYDLITEMPCGARNFEPAALASAESVNILRYLMALEKPTPEIVNAIQYGKAFLTEKALMGVAWVKNADPAVGNRLVEQVGAKPLWSRYYDAVTLKPIFGDRDRTIHDNVNDISAERRNGYAWFNTAPARILSRLR